MGVCISFRRTSDCYSDAAEPMNGLAGNKALFRSLSGLPKVYAEWPCVERGDMILRPTDFAPWRDWVAKLPHNVDHFTAMLDTLETDAYLWLDFGY